MTTLASPPPSIAGGQAAAAQDSFEDLDDDILDSLDGSANAVDADGNDTTASDAGASVPAGATASPTAASPSAPTDEAPVPAGTTAPATPTVVAPATPAAPVETEEQKTARLAAEQANRTKWLGELEKAPEIPKEDHEALLTAPETVIPKLAARLHAQMVEVVAPQIAAQVMAMLPSVLQRTTSFEAREAKAKGDFFSRHAYLNKPEYEQAILKAGVAYRQVHPDANPDEAMEGMAMLAAKALKLSYVAFNGDTAAAAAPAQQRKMPRPANAGGGKSVQSTTNANPGDNPWAELAEEDV